MKRILSTIFLIATAFVLTACIDEDQTKRQQHKAAEAAANSLNFTDNAEIDNIKRRLELTSKPGLMGYIVLMNDAGQPVFYGTIKGKVTSGSKRLTRPRWVDSFGSLNQAITDAPSDEGTYGSSTPYIFFWTTSGAYMQWSGQYLYSDKPIRLSVQPLAVSIEAPAQQ